MVGINVVVVIPENITISSTVLEKIAFVSSITGAKLILTHDPRDAVTAAKIVATGLWYDTHYHEPTKNEE